MPSISEMVTGADGFDISRVVDEANRRRSDVIRELKFGDEVAAFLDKHMITQVDVKSVFEAIVHCSMTEQDRE